MRTSKRLVQSATMFSLTLSLFFASTAHPQRLDVDTYTVAEGLPSSAIFDVGQDGSGRLWVVTRGGVVVFDGLQWSNVPLAGPNPVTRFESALTAGPSGEVWIASNDQDLKLVRTDGDDLTAVEIPAGLVSGEISGLSMAVAGDSDNPTVVIGTSENGALVRVAGEWSELRFPADLPSNKINDLIADGSRILIATDRGLCWFDDSATGCIDPGKFGAPGSSVTAFARSAGPTRNSSPLKVVLAGTSWVGNLSGTEITDVAPMRANGSDLSLQQVSLTVGPDESVFVGSPRVVYRVDRHTGKAVPIGPADGLAANGSTAMLADREGNVWVGSMRGLSKVVFDRFASFTAEHGLLDDEVTAVAEVRPGFLVFGHNSGLTFFSEGEFQTLSFSDDFAGIGDKFRVMDLAVDVDKSLWIAASQKGLGRMAPDGDLTWFAEESGLSFAVTTVLCDQGGILVGTQNGLYRRSAGSTDFLPVNLKGAPEVIRRLNRGADGTIFVATANSGIYALRDGQWREAHYSHGRAANLTTAVYSDSAEQVLVGTDAGVVGLAGRELVDLGEPWSAINRPVYFFVSDGEGNLWLGTDHGVRAWDGNRLWTFDAHHGLAGDETNRGAGLVDSAGRLWVGTDRGVSFREPGPLSGNTEPPIALILGVETSDGLLHPLSESTELPHTAQTLVFHFRCVSLIDERQQRYRARLVGYDDDWVGPYQLTTSGLRYTHIPPGRYVFEIQVENVHGLWSDAVSSVPFVISRPWWLSQWFLVLMLGLSFISIAAASRHLRQKYREAFVDRLTGLPNRAGILRQIGREVRKLGSGEEQLAVLLLDLDRFRHINSSLGHRAGDEVLIQTARRLENAIPAGMPPGRLGGDEFVVLLSGNPTPEVALKVAENLQEVLALPFETEGLEAYLGACVGIRMCAGRWADPHHLLRDADAAMHQAKDNGLARTVVFDASMHSDSLNSLTLEGELKKAAVRGQLMLHYQPLYHLSTNTLAGFEALIRWRHPTRGLLRPDSFLSIAEASGLIVEIGGWVIKEACDQLAEWRSSHAEAQELVVSVNLSSQQVADPRLVRTIGTALENSGLPASCVKLELTENSIMGSDRSVTSRLDHLRHRELGVWVDDFGTGYSSLSYLQRLPIDALKIDRSFVSDLSGENVKSGILEAILSLGKNLDLTVIAEGIETKDQLNRLQELGCRLGQGYLLGRPLPADEVEDRYFGLSEP